MGTTKGEKGSLSVARVSHKTFSVKGLLATWNPLKNGGYGFLAM